MKSAFSGTAGQGKLVSSHWFLHFISIQALKEKSMLPNKRRWFICSKLPAPTSKTITKTSPNKTHRSGVALPFFLVGHNWILNCGNWEPIGEQDGETMGSTPLLIKIDCHLDVFFLIRVPSNKFYFLCLLLYKVFIGILGESPKTSFWQYFIYCRF